jgi:acylphosphatase
MQNRPNISIMKLRITITGPRVHDVGYRYFLLGGAMGLRLPGFDASNLTDGKNQVVDIVIDGKESPVEAFKEYAKTKKLSGAEVSSINISDYDGDVMRMAEYSQVLTAMQMLKAIPTMLEIRDSTRRIAETTRRTEEKIGGIEEISRRTEEKIGGIEETSRKTEENTQAIPALADGVRELRLDVALSVLSNFLIILYYCPINLNYRFYIKK